MRQVWYGFALTAAIAGGSGLFVRAQDSPSLGEVARQARLQKQSKETQSKDIHTKDVESNGTTAKPGATAKAPRIITNEELQKHSEPSTPSSGARASEREPADSTAPSGSPKMPAEECKLQILAQKETVKTLQDNIDKLNDSIQFAPGNCVSGCVQWNEQQQKKQLEVERMRGELEAQKKQLQDMQESARQQGYGSSVYDP
jgi:hypothetical protein